MYGIGESLVAIGASIAAAAASAAISAAMAPEIGVPNTGVGASAALSAKSEQLLQRRAIEQAAKLGSTAVRPGYNEVGVAELTREIGKLQSEVAALPKDSSRRARASNAIRIYQELLPQVQANEAAGKKTYLHQMGENSRIVPEKEALIDFRGLGEAEVQAKLAKELAGIQYEIQDKYGSQFVDEARKQLEQSDPEGTQARAMAYDLIQKQMANQPERPVADLLDKQVGQELANGNRLNDISSSILDQAVAQANASRGQVGGSEGIRNEMESGFAGQQRLRGAQQKALGWLSSGATPEDVQYRREQQNLSNLGAFLTGETPVSQFQNLSGAQSGAAPFTGAQELPRSQGNPAAAGSQASLQGWNMQNQYAQSQANPWMAGLSMLLQGANAYSAGKQ